MPLYKCFKTLLPLLALCFSNGISFPALSQQARMEVSPEEILIGQHSELRIEIRIPDSGTVLYPDPADILNSDIEVISRGVPDTIDLSDGELMIRQVHIVTAWDEGYYPIQPQRYNYVRENDTIYFETRPALLHVSGVEVDMESQYRDIHPIWRLPLSAIEVLSWAVPVILVLLLAAYLVKRFLNKETPEKEPEIFDKPGVPAHIAAISSLETLRRKELWQKGRVKQYYVELSTILRKYISKRYKIDSMEMTTAEILNELPALIMDDGLMKGITEVFEAADLVKFAKHEPLPEFNKRVIEIALEFVRSTVPESS